jgi:hypothetical protein
VNGKNEKALFASALMAVKWDSLFQLETCSKQFELFSSTIQDLLDTFIPLKESKQSQSDKPWVTQKYKSLIQQRQKALFRNDTVLYRSLRNKINRLSHHLRSHFYQSKVTDLSQNDSKKWWSCINDLMGRKHKANVLTNLANQHTGGDEEKLANIINETFQSVSADLPKLVPTHQHPTIVPDKFQVSIMDVEKKLMAIDIKKAMGPDGIPNWVLRDFAGFLSPPIAAIFNSSFREGYIPSVWKSADVVPLPKVHPPQRLDKDLRPISLTPTISKVQEQFVYAWYWEIIQDKIDKLQFGALKGTCTTHALITMVHDWSKATDDSRNKNYVHIVLLDYAKAFDHVDPNILINKLEALDIPYPLIRWTESFLMNRHQRVKIGQYISRWLEIWGTVPQGTLLGVLCFLCMINDLKTECTAIKYVDDTTIYRAMNDPSDPTLQSSVNVAIKWSKANNMKINAAKTKDMVVSFTREEPDIPNILVDGTPIERVTECKLLGVMLNNRLTWHTHVDTIYKKACSRLHFVAQLKKTKMPASEIIKVYTTLVRPLLEYACQVWHGGLTDQQVTLLESIQERVMKMAYPCLTYQESLSECDLPTLQVRRDLCCRTLFNSMCHSDHRLNHLLPPKRQSQYDSRSTQIYVLPRVKTNRFKNSFVPFCLFKF